MPRDQQSSIDRLPEDIREQLEAMLNDRRLTQTAVKKLINEILDADGHEQRLSYSAINRHKRKLDRIGKDIRETREVASMMIGKLGVEPQGETGKLINEMIKTMVFRVTRDMAAGDAPLDTKMLKDLAISVKRLEQAASENVRRDAEIRKQEREKVQGEAVEALENIADAETIKQFRKKFL